MRGLEKRIAKLVRNIAKDTAMEKEVDPKMTIARIEEILGVPREKDKYENNNVPGVVTGLAWTQVGGDILFIESILSNGKGQLSMTGNLGKVMKESAQIALEYVKAHHEKLGIDSELIENQMCMCMCQKVLFPKMDHRQGLPCSQVSFLPLLKEK